METAYVQWQAQQGEWQVTPLSATTGFDGASQSLAQWASTLADLTQVRLVLSASNYSSHWLAMPGVNNRNLARALPFALEESLINDISDYLIVPAGSHTNKKVRAFAVASDLIERLLEACELHHLRVMEVVGETQLLGSDNIIRRQQQGWQISLPGYFEGWVGEAALTPVLEHILREPIGGDLHLYAPALDQVQLLKTTLESSFADAFEQIEMHASDGQQLLEQGLKGKLTSLLTGQFQVKAANDDKPAAWWRPLAAMAAVWAVFTASYLFIDGSTLKQQEMQVRQASINLYKQLFPGERVRNLKRQFSEKMDGNGQSSSDTSGFIALVNKTAETVRSSNSKINIQSLRFSDRSDELQLELSAGALSDIQSLKQALEQQGLSAEVASASNDKDGVKGRMKIRRPA